MAVNAIWVLVAEISEQLQFMDIKRKLLRIKSLD